MRKHSRLIIFFIPPEKLVNGGILSIFSICKVSREFSKIHNAEVVLATYPGKESYHKNDLFKNDEYIYSFDELVARGAPESLLLHVPEYASYDVFMSLKKYAAYIDDIKDLRINIMNQNILLMQPPYEVANWFSLTPNVTQTLAHNKYSTQEIADTYNLPTRHLSTFVDQSQYKWVDYEQKKNVIALTLDETPKKAAIVALLKKRLPGYELITIQNLSYEQYKEFMSNTKFTITFGEGFDGYYVEAFFTGGVTFAAYNDEFFPDKEFGTFDNTFTGYDDMLDNIVDRIRKLDGKAAYEKVVKQNLAKINKLYSFATYTENVKKFYLGEFNFLPQKLSAERLIGVVIRDKERLAADKDRLIRERDKTITDMEKMIADKGTAISELDQKIADMEHSQSWRITKPLRKASAVIKKR